MARSMLAGVCLTLMSSWALSTLGWFTQGELVATYEKRNTKIPPDLVPEGWDPRSWHYFTGPGVRRDLVSECEWMGSTLGMRMGGGPQRTIVHIRAGWPFLAMAWWDYRSPEAAVPAPTGIEEAWQQGVDIGLASIPGPAGRFGVARKIPIRPLWGGFLLNSMVYAFVAVIGVRGAAALRRARRRKRGLCERCAYPVSDLAACPECGFARIRGV